MFKILYSNLIHCEFCCVLALLIQSTVVDVKESDSENEENAQIIKNFLIDSHLQFTMNEDTAKAVLYLRIKWFSYFFRCLRYPSRATSTVSLWSITMVLDEKRIYF